MSQTLVRPPVVDVRVDVHDLRGAQAPPTPRPVLHDPSGVRARRLRALSRGVMGVLVAWLAGLSLAGLGLVPTAMIPLGYLVAAPAPKALITMSTGSDSASASAGRPGSSSPFGVAVRVATERLAPPAGPPFAGDVMRGEGPRWRRAPGLGAGVTPFIGDQPPTVTVSQPRTGAAPASPDSPAAPAPGGSAPTAPGASGGNEPAASGSVPAPSAASPTNDAPSASESAPPGDSAASPPRADGAAPGASATAPGRTGEAPATSNGNGAGNGNAGNAGANAGNANAGNSSNAGGNSANANAGTGNANAGNNANAGTANANGGNNAKSNANEGGQARGRSGAAF